MLGEFANRREAGRRLGARLAELKLEDPVVLGLPRGGVPVAYEVALALDAPLDVLLVRKIGFPGHPELALGAVVDGIDPQVVVNESVAALLGGDVGPYLEKETARQLRTIEQRRALYRQGRAAVPIAGRTAVVVDDGVATGSTIEVALKALARGSPLERIVAVPVAPPDVAERLTASADRVICLATPEPFIAVGAHYRDFSQTTDEEVTALLDAAAARSSAR